MANYAQYAPAIQNNSQQQSAVNYAQYAPALQNQTSNADSTQQAFANSIANYSDKGGLVDSIKDLIEHPVNTAQNVSYGALKGAGDLAKTLGSIGYNYLGGKQLDQFMGVPGIGDPSNVNVAQTLQGAGITPNNSISSGFAQGVGNFIPYAALPIGEAIKGASAVGDIPGISQALSATGNFASKNMPFLSDLVSGAASSAAPTAAKLADQAGIGFAQGYSSGQDPNSQLSSGLKEGLLNSLVSGALLGGSNLVQGLRPTNLLKGNLSNDQLAANLAAAAGTKTNIGDITGSRAASGLFTNLTNVPLSGAYNTMQDTMQVLGNSAQNIADDFGFSNNDPTGTDVQDALKDAMSNAQQQKNALYDDVNNIADQYGVKVGNDNLKAAAQSELDSLNSSPKLKSSTSPELLNDLNFNSSLTDNEPLKPSNIYKGQIGDKVYANKLAGNSHDASVYSNLQNAAGQDISDAIANSGNDELKNAYSVAQQNYAQNFAPFDDDNLMKFIKPGADSDLIINHFIKGGSNDRGNLINTFVDRLPPEQQDILGRAYLGKAADSNGNIDPGQLNKLWTNLGPQQQEALIRDPELRNQLNDFSNSWNITSNTRAQLANPNNGAKAASLIGSLAPFAAGIGSLYAGHPIGAAGIGGAIGLSNLLTKYLTNEGVRNKIVNNIMTGTKFSPSNNFLSGANAIRSGISNINNS